MYDSIGRQMFLKLFKPDGKLTGKELALRLATTPQNVGNWKAGTSKPTTRVREIIQAHWPAIRLELWDQPPASTVALPPEPTAKKQAALQPPLTVDVPTPVYVDDIPEPTPPPIPKVSVKALADLGPEGIEQLIGRLLEVQAHQNTTPAERLKAMSEERQARVQLAQIRAKARTDRETYLASPEAKQDVADLYRRLGPEFQAALRKELSDLPFPLPDPAQPAAQPITFETFQGVLQSAQELKEVGEVLLSAAELSKLQLSLNCDGIAKMLSEQKATRLVGTLETLATLAPEAHTRVKHALDTYNTLQDIREAPTREAVAHLLILVGRPALASELS